MSFDPNGPGRPRNDTRQGAPILKYRPPVAPAEPDRVRPGEVCLPEQTLRELLLAAKEAANLVADLSGAAGVRRLEIPQARRLAAAISFAEKACRKRANEMKKGNPNP